MEEGEERERERENFSTNQRFTNRCSSPPSFFLSSSSDLSQGRSQVHHEGSFTFKLLLEERKDDQIHLTLPFFFRITGDPGINWGSAAADCHQVKVSPHHACQTPQKGS